MKNRSNAAFTVTVLTIIGLNALSVGLMLSTDSVLEEPSEPQTGEEVQPVEAPQTLKLTNRDIDYRQWVLMEASKDTPLSAYPATGIRADVQFARENMTEDERFDMWFQLETMRIPEFEYEFDLSTDPNLLS